MNVMNEQTPIAILRAVHGARNAFRRALIAAAVLLAGASQAPAAAPTAGTTPPNPDYGLKVYKSGNCMGCHKWHGSGGPGYGGAALSLRATQLDRDQIIEVVKCGRPGTNMPFHDRTAYKDDHCYARVGVRSWNDGSHAPGSGLGLTGHAAAGAACRVPLRRACSRQGDRFRARASDREPYNPRPDPSLCV